MEDWLDSLWDNSCLVDSKSLAKVFRGAFGSFRSIVGVGYFVYKRWGVVTGRRSASIINVNILRDFLYLFVVISKSFERMCNQRTNTIL